MDLCCALLHLCESFRRGHELTISGNMEYYADMVLIIEVKTKIISKNRIEGIKPYGTENRTNGNRTFNCFG